MLPSVSSRSRWLVFLALLGVVGCQPSSSSIEQKRIASTADADQDTSSLAALRRHWESGDVGQKADQLWQDVQNHYATMPSYSDEAQVQLSYELLSNMIHETMPASIAYQRPRGDSNAENLEKYPAPNKSAGWHGQVFRAHLFGDSQHVAMTINEPSTNHLDRQVKLFPSPRGLASLSAEDPVAKIYLSGATDIPLSEQAINQLVLFSPQLEWLDSLGWTPETSKPNPHDSAQRNQQSQTNAAVGQAATSPSVFRGLAVHNDHTCVKLSRKFRGFETEFWIDVDDRLIRKLVFDNSLLDATLSNTPEVRRLQIQIDFGEIVAGERARTPLSLKEFPTDRTLHNFVKIPEAFPSPWIGRRSPELSLKNHSGSPIRIPSKRGPTVAVFLSQLDANTDWWQTLQRLSSDEKLKSAQVVLVLDGMETGAVVTPVANRPVELSEPQLLPYGAGAWQAFGLNQGRWVVVWDTTGTVQYIGPAEREGIIDTVGTIFQRLSQGESIGEEMIAEYQSFYSDYLKHLEAQRVSTLPEVVGATQP